jgi:hypothetical protein
MYPARAVVPPAETCRSGPAVVWLAETCRNGPAVVSLSKTRRNGPAVVSLAEMRRKLARLSEPRGQPGIRWNWRIRAHRV